jgi:hypothetical protein
MLGSVTPQVITGRRQAGYSQWMYEDKYFTQVAVRYWRSAAQLPQLPVNPSVKVGFKHQLLPRSEGFEIVNTLNTSVNYTVVNAFKGTTHLKAHRSGQLLQCEPQCHWRVESLRIRTVHSGYCTYRCPWRMHCNCCIAWFLQSVGINTEDF